jgi:hypothetical protein
MRLGGDDVRGRYEPIGIDTGGGGGGGGGGDEPIAPGQYFSADGEYITITAKGKSIICSVLGVLILAFFAWLWTVHFVAYDEMCLVRHRLGSVYEQPILKQGIHNLVPWKGTVCFPSTMQEVRFNSTAFSDSGVAFLMEIEFYYQLPPENLFQIYNRFSYNYRASVLSNSRKTISNLAGRFSVSDFMGNRTYIETVLSRGISGMMAQEVHVTADPALFRIINIVFPENIVTNSLKSAIALQSNELQSNLQAVNIVKADTKQLIASILASSTQSIQNSISKSNAIIKTASFESDNLLISARSSGISYVMKAVGIPLDLVNDFVNVMALLDNKLNKTVFRNMTSSNVIVDVF